MAIDEPKDAPDSWQPWLEHVLVAMTLLAMLATSLRIISRRLNRQALWWDDWLAVWNMVRRHCHFAPVGIVRFLTLDAGLVIDYRRFRLHRDRFGPWSTCSIRLSGKHSRFDQSSLGH